MSEVQKIEVEIVEEVIVNKYKVLKTFTYIDTSMPIHLEVTLHKDSTIERFVDDKENFSDGWSIISQNVLDANSDYFEAVWE